MPNVFGISPRRCPLAGNKSYILEHQARSRAAPMFNEGMEKSVGQNVVKFDELGKADLHVDAIYLGGDAGNISDSPLNRLVPGLSNAGGFRQIVKVANKPKRVRLCALVSSGSDPDWPDNLDQERGVYTYYGDNRKAGNHDMHSTSRGGNVILRDAFSNLHSNRRDLIPPFLIFEKEGTKGFAYKFKGLAVPGVNGLGPSEDLVAIWKSDTNNNRFLNYRSRFTVLNIETIPRAWILEIRETGESCGLHAPRAWRDFVETGKTSALIAPRAIRIRSKSEQLPENSTEWEVLNTIVSHYKNHPSGEYAFERCAIEICLLSDAKILELDLTPPTRDGGRDGVGVYRLGTDFSYIKVEFSMEAKCYDPQNSNGVKLTSRLISRLRHRQFGYFVTTSFVAAQAYQEIIDDNHPVVIFSGRDVAKILIEHGYNSGAKVKAWLGRVDQGVGGR